MYRGGTTFLLELSFAGVDSQKFERGDLMPTVVSFHKIAFTMNNIYNPTSRLVDPRVPWLSGDAALTARTHIPAGLPSPMDGAQLANSGQARTAPSAQAAARGRTQLEDENEPDDQFVDDPILGFGGQAFDKETFALRWTPGAQKVYNFPPPGAGGVSGFLLIPK